VGQEQPAELPLRAAYSVHDGCPDEATFLARILERSPQSRVAEPGELARTLVVNIVQDGEASAGTISMLDQRGDTSTREVAAASCDGVVTALALVAAVFIEEQAAAADVAESISEEATPPSAGSAPKPQSSSDAPKPAPPSPKPTGRVASNAASASPPTREELSNHWLAAGAKLEATTAHDGLTLAPGAFAQVEFAVGALTDAALRLGAFYRSKNASAPGGEADFTWWMGRLELCPVSVGSRSRLVLRPCVGAEAGVVKSQSSFTPSGGATARDDSGVKPWGASFALLRLEWHALGSLWLEADGGIEVPFTRYSFKFVDDAGETTVLETPPVGILGGVGLGLGLL